MIRIGVLVAAAAALAACATQQPDDPRPWHSSARPAPSVVEPGLTVDGYVNIGVSGRL